MGIYWYSRCALTTQVRYRFMVLGNVIQRDDYKSLGSINPPYKLENVLLLGTIHRFNNATPIYIISAWGSVSGHNVTMLIDLQ